MGIVMTQQACVISNLSFEFPTQLMFDQLNFVLFSGQISALIGRNGLGKSLLFKLLHAQNNSEFAFSGNISWNIPHDYLPQLQRLNTNTIAHTLGVEHLHHAFLRIENNTATYEDYDLVEHCWDLPQQWQNILLNANLPTDLEFPVHQLSEGQKTKLALCRLFLKQDHYLLLDEPSNHLDASARQWLIESIHAHKGGVCIISHDRQLLQHAQHIFALSDLGLRHVSGNYDDYFEQYQLQLNALTQSIQQEKRTLKLQCQQQHETLMKTQKRQRKGIQLRAASSQAKVLLDFKKERAGHSFGKLKAQQVRQNEESYENLNEKQKQFEKIKPQKFEFHFHSTQSGEILRLNDVKIPYRPDLSIKFAVHMGEKLHLKGKNGVGKSTLLKMIHQHEHGIIQNHLQNADVFKIGQSIYLDQNFSLLDDELTVIENLTRFNPNILEVEWRGLLGQLRIRREKSLLQIAQLSGGEKLKVALLAISHAQQNVDLLLLDEPENHLDIESKALLAQAISQFKGASILVSHDDIFVDQCGIIDEYILN